MRPSNAPIDIRTTAADTSASIMLFNEILKYDKLNSGNDL